MVRAIVVGALRTMHKGFENKKGLEELENGRKIVTIQTTALLEYPEES